MPPTAADPAAQHVPAAVRRERLEARLRDASDPIPGARLAEVFGVSRQIIVQDVAVLRAAGAPVVATIRGYVLERPSSGPSHRAIVAVRHGRPEAEDELLAIVDVGVRVVDVIVEHPLYGELRGPLQLASPADVRAWAEATTKAGIRLLSELTDGVHLHTIEASSLETLERARAALAVRGYLLEVREET